MSSEAVQISKSLHNLMTNNTCKTFYSKLPSNLVKKLPTAKIIFGENSIQKYYSAMNIPSISYKFRNGKCEEIYNILISIDPNKTYGIDEIPRRSLKDRAELLTETLCKIINLSLGSKFSVMCYATKVKPFYERDKNTEHKNYRSVSFLPMLSKIIERVIFKQVTEHLEEHDILYKYIKDTKGF